MRVVTVTVQIAIRAREILYTTESAIMSVMVVGNEQGARRLRETREELEELDGSAS